MGALFTPGVEFVESDVELYYSIENPNDHPLWLSACDRGATPTLEVQSDEGWGVVATDDCSGDRQAALEIGEQSTVEGMLSPRSRVVGASYRLVVRFGSDSRGLRREAVSDPFRFEDYLFVTAEGDAIVRMPGDSEVVSGNASRHE